MDQYFAECENKEKETRIDVSVSTERLSPDKKEDACQYTPQTTVEKGATVSELPHPCSEVRVSRKDSRSDTVRAGLSLGRCDCNMNSVSNQGRSFEPDTPPPLDMDDGVGIYEVFVKLAGTTKYMKVDRRSSPWSLLLETLDCSQRDSYLFTARERTGIDDYCTVPDRFSYNTYVLSVSFDGNEFYIHPEYDGSDDVLQLRLSPASPDLFNGRNITQKARRYHFCQWRVGSIIVVESFAFQGFYISFEGDQVVMRKTKPSDVQANNHVEIHCEDNCRGCVPM